MLARAPDPLLAAQRDPVWWIRQVSASRPWLKQKCILASIRDNKWTAVPSCHGAGKSWIAAHSALWFLYAHPNSIVFTTAPTFRQVQEIVWQEIRLAHANARLPLMAQVALQTKLSIADKWFAFGFASDSSHGAQGLHADHILALVDEACGIEPQIWDAIKGNLSTGHARALLIGNPTDPAAHFADFCAEDRDDVNVIRISAFDTPNFVEMGITVDDIRSGEWAGKQAAYIGAHGNLPTPYLTTPEWVSEMHREGEDSPFWVSRVLAHFPEQGENTVISQRWVEDAEKRELPPSEQPTVLAVDVARFGDDKTVIYARKGPLAWCVAELSGKDTREVSAECLMRRHELKATTIAVDETGLGAGVVDTLVHAIGRGNVISINGAESPLEKNEGRFINKRAEMYWALREIFKSGKVQLKGNTRTLKRELSKIRYFMDNKGRIGIESKKDMKARGLKSPDHADCLSYLFSTSKSHVNTFISAMRNA